MPTLSIPSRFCGPAGSANGGYMCGRVAGYLDGPAVVTLRQPPPLETPMTVEADGEGVRVHHDATLIAEAGPERESPPLAIPGSVSVAEVRAAQAPSRYYEDPAFPECFVCGPQRRPGDGLRIFPGRVTGRSFLGTQWTPDASLADGGDTIRPEIAWAALDCPSGLAAIEDAEIGQQTAIVLGRMTASLAALPAVGDECAVIGWPIGRDGRKLRAGSALLGPGGEVLAVASTVWLTVPRKAVGGAP